MIFNDGVDHLRLEFAQKSWPLLRIGGHILFHDTRRPADFANILNFLQTVYLETDIITVNERASNITSIRKNIKEPYVNWNFVEGRQPK